MLDEHGSQVKDQGRRQFCHNKHKKFPYRSTRDVSLLSGHASYIQAFGGEPRRTDHVEETGVDVEIIIKGLYWK